MPAYNWERGAYNPSATMLRQLARPFGVGMDDVALAETREGKAAA